MRLKIVSVVCIPVALAISQLAAAAERPAPAPLGQVESILDSCAAAKPKESENYKKQRAKLTEGVPEKEVAEIRSSEEYREAYSTIRERFDHASREEVDKACSVFLGRK